MKKRYRVELTPAERRELEARTRAGTMNVRAFKRAQILLKADVRAHQPELSDAAISQAVGVSPETVLNVRKRFLCEGLRVVLRGKYAGNHPRRLDGAAEAHLIALTCSEPPEDRDHWTMQLLADKMVELGYVEHLSDETVRKTLKKTHSSRG